MSDTTIALVAVVIGAISAFVTLIIAEKRIGAEHVTAERAKWREKIREKALEVHDALLLSTPSNDKLLRLRMEFGALLNPNDCYHDQGILNCIDVCGPDECRSQRAKEFGKRIALLLKHDWQRAKLEAGFSPWRLLVRAKRRPYECAVENDNSENPVSGAASCTSGRRTWLRRCRCDWRSFWRNHEVRCFPVAALAVVISAGTILLCFAPDICCRASPSYCSFSR